MSEKILINCHVAVAFHDRHGNFIHNVPASLRHHTHEAPAEIQDDINFNLLMNDEALEIVNSEARKKQLELDPVQNTDAEGKNPNARPQKSPKSEKPSA